MGIEGVENLSDQSNPDNPPKQTDEMTRIKEEVKKTTTSGPVLPVSDGVAGNDEEIHDKQQAELDAERDEHNRRARESAGQDDRISDDTGERHAPTSSTSSGQESEQQQ